MAVLLPSTRQAKTSQTKTHPSCRIRAPHADFRNGRERKVRETQIPKHNPAGQHQQEEAEQLTTKDLRRDGRLSHLLALRKSTRNRLLNVTESETKQLYHLRRAEEKVRKLACKNARLSVDHSKGERRKTQRIGCGKSMPKFQCFSLGYDDIVDACERARSTARHDHYFANSFSQANLFHSGESYNPVDQLAHVLEQSMRGVTLAVYDLEADLRTPQLCCRWGGATRWNEGLQVASRIAAKYRKGLSHLMNIPDLIQSLRNNGEDFDNLRAEFLVKWRHDLKKSLDASVSQWWLSAAPLASQLQESFLVASDGKVDRIAPGFHGTPGINHSSIFSRGLLVPGADSGENDIRVANGSVHGNGVYIAKLTNPWLSQGFTRGTSKMMVCGVVDDAIALANTKRIGCLSIGRESPNVRHVGDAMVVFETARVAPLFVAEWGANPTSRSTQVMPVTKKRAARNSRQKKHLGRCFGFAVRQAMAWERIKHRRTSWIKKNLPQVLTYKYGWSGWLGKSSFVDSSTLRRWI